MQVKCVGDKSQFGRLAQELKEDDERESPLKVKLGKVADTISKFGYIGGTLIAVAFMINCIFFNPTLLPGATTYFSMENIMQILRDLVSSVTLAVVIIVVAVPEGLPMMIALVSGLNMKKLLKDNILIRKSTVRRQLAALTSSFPIRRVPSPRARSRWWTLSPRRERIIRVLPASPILCANCC